MGKKILIILIMVVFSLSCLGQDNKGESFYNIDGSQNAYFIDTLHIDSLVIVRSKKNGHFFAIRNLAGKSLKGKIWNHPDTYLYDNCEPFYSWLLKDLPENVIPNSIWGTSLNNGKIIKYFQYSDSMPYQIVTNHQVPKYYWFVMIRGDAYNYLTVRSVFDSGRKLIKFKNDKAYYKLLIPVW